MSDPVSVGSKATGALNLEGGQNASTLTALPQQHAGLALAPITSGISEDGARGRFTPHRVHTG